MSRMCAGALAAAAVLAIAVPATAQDLETADCGQAVPLDAGFVAAIEPGKFVTAHLGGGDVLLVAEAESGLGVGTFVRRNGRWRAYGLSTVGGTEGVYRSSTGAVFAWAYNGRGDPPSSYTGFHVGAKPDGQFCTEIEPPAELNRSLTTPGERDWRGEFLDFEAFNVDDSGSGAILGSAEVLERAGGQPTQVTYRYGTRNSGRTWATPMRISAQDNPVGVYTQVTSAEAAVLADLRQAAR